MANPLRKRYPRMLRAGIGRYLSIFLLLSVCIGLVSGFLVAASNIEKLFGEIHETYFVEDGRFETDEKVKKKTLESLNSLGVSTYENFNHDVQISTVDGTEVLLRVYGNRNEINKASLYEGSLPSQANQIAIDETFASNHEIKVGDHLSLEGNDFVISGLMILPDYTALFESNTSFTLNSTTFCVGTVTQEGFESLDSVPIHYTYSYVFDDDSLSVAERTNLETDIAEKLTDDGYQITDLIDALDNQGINYAGEDVSHDQVIYQVLLILIIVIMAFVFALTTNSAIEAESSVIGMLLASGYTNGQLVRHYVFLPAVVGFIACVVGNAAGYVWLSEPMRDLYYNSYSFPPYEASFNLRIFLITTVVPYVLLVGISVWGIARKLHYTPLQFLRHDISRKSRRNTVALPEKLSYTSRFRLRVFIRNLPHFVTLFAGIAFSSLLLVFGLALLPVMENYAGVLSENLPVKYLYTLKAPYELEMTDEQQKVRDEIKEAKKLEKALDKLKESGTALMGGSSELSSALQQGARGGSQLSDAGSALSEGTEQMSDGSDTFASTLSEQSKQQGKLSKGIDLSQEQGAYASALQEYIKSYASSLAAGGDPGEDTSVASAYAKLESALTALLTKAGEKGGYEGASQALSQVAESFKQLNDGAGKIDSSTKGFSEGVDTLNSGLQQLSTGFDEYSEGVEAYSDAVTKLIDSARELMEDDDAANELRDRYHVVAKEGSNAQEAIDAAEKIAVGQLEMKRLKSDSNETVTVYGIQENSRYWKDIDVTDGKVVAGTGLAEKCGANESTVAVLYNKYQDENYALKISAQAGNRADTNLYMSLQAFNELFDNETEYFNGYASDKELNIDSDYLASLLTPEDMRSMADQMTDSMGEVVQFVVFLAVFVFFIVMYLLTKTAIEQSARSISLMKVFGYRDKEINRLYIRSITCTVVASLLISLPLVIGAVILLCQEMLVDYSGNFIITVPWTVLVADVVIGLLTYAVVAFLHVRHIRRVPLTLALKFTE